LEEERLLDSLPEEAQDQIWSLAIDLALVEDDSRSLPAKSRAALRRRYITREGIESHPHARIIYWIEEGLLREDRALLYRLKR
jgi:hypothetical protein